MISKEYLKGDLDGILQAYAESIKTGCKPAAVYEIERHLVPRAVEILNRENLYYTIFPVEHEDYRRVAIYNFRDLPLNKIILFIEARELSTDKQLGAWIAGKLFGYNDRDIVSYLEQITN